MLTLRLKLQSVDCMRGNLDVPNIDWEIKSTGYFKFVCKVCKNWSEQNTLFIWERDGMGFPSSMTKWAWFNPAVFPMYRKHTLSRTELHTFSTPCNTELDYHASHVRLTRMHYIRCLDKFYNEQQLTAILSFLPEGVLCGSKNLYEKCWEERNLR